MAVSEKTDKRSLDGQEELSNTHNMYEFELGELYLKEDDYKLLFNSMISPFSFSKMVFNLHGEPIDYIFLAVNNAFETETGFRRKDIIGKSVLDIFPLTERYWIERLGKVALIGIEDKFENYAQALNSWYEVRAYSPSKGYFAMTVINITEQKKYEEDMKNLNVTLEHKVLERTTELQTINSLLEELNARLEEEISERQKDKAKILNLNEQLERKVAERTNKLKIMNSKLKKEIYEKGKMHERLEKYKLLANKAHDCMFFLDMNGNILEVNDAAVRNYGYTIDEFTSMSIFNLRHTEKPSSIIEQMTVADKEGIIFEAVHYRKDGTSINVEVSSQGAMIGSKRVLLSIIRDITYRKKAEEEIVYLSYHDQLTGLYNRRFYEEELIRLDTERNLPLTLVMADMNGLKLANDAFGHLVGDGLIKRTADILKKECRCDDIIARIGGDEFVVILPQTNSEEAEKIVRRINNSISKERVGTIVLSVSFGWSTKYKAQEEINSVFNKAEDSMYKRKMSESSSIKNETLGVVMRTFNEKNKVEQLHSERVSELSVELGLALGLSMEAITELRSASLMHDIGKIAINQDILNKPDKLNDAEWTEVKRHSEIGYRILNSIDEFSQLAVNVKGHHERWDGEGYPQGLKGLEIPHMSRIITIADAYDAMTSERSYRNALSEEDVIKELHNNAGTQFDPELVEVFIKKILRQ